MSEIEAGMTNTETAAYLRKWVKEGGQFGHSVWNWPTDGCGYDQHIRFVRHRNEHWQGGEFDQFVLDYADMIEKETEQ